MQPTSSTGSTKTPSSTRKISACFTLGKVCPTSIVQGMSRSGTRLRSLSHAMVGANDPIPSVSKKLVTAPRTITSTRGHAARATAPCSSLAAQIAPASANALSNVMSMTPPGVG